VRQPTGLLNKANVRVPFLRFNSPERTETGAVFYPLCGRRNPAGGHPPRFIHCVTLFHQPDEFSPRGSLTYSLAYGPATRLPKARAVAPAQRHEKPVHQAAADTAVTESRGHRPDNPSPDTEDRGTSRTLVRAYPSAEGSQGAKGRRCEASLHRKS
jgi:hypothetical protein